MYTLCITHHYENIGCTIIGIIIVLCIVGRRLKIESPCSASTGHVVLSKAEYTVKGRLENKETIRRSYN